MTNTFTLNTSGHVGEMPGWKTPVPTCNRFMRWEDLTPFAQGYIAAMFEAAEAALVAQTREAFGSDCSDEVTFGFSDLSPEALASIIADCERVSRADYIPGALLHPNSSDDGRWFFAKRQEGEYRKAYFPPVTVYLDDAGQVQIGEVK